MKREDYNKLLCHLPEYGQRVLVRHMDGRVAASEFSASLTTSDEVKFREAGFDRWDDVVAWHPGPALEDWREGNHPPGTPETLLVCRHFYQSRFYVRERGTPGERLSFPGFLGGERSQFDSVISWAPIPVDGWMDVPQEFLALPTRFAYQERQKTEWLDDFSWQVFLAATNDGDFYRSHWSKLMSNAKIQHRRFKLVPLRDYKGERRPMLLNWVCKALIAFTERNEALREEIRTAGPLAPINPFNRVLPAAQMLLEYYMRRAKEGANG